MMIPFNADERLAQAQAGGGPAASPIRDTLAEQHRSFFEGLRYVAVATTGSDGWPDATMLAGEAGFIASPDATTLRIVAPGLEVAVDQPVALLGIDLATRRRNRANGQVSAAGPDGFAVRVRESFGNCPKYIQRRDVTAVPRVAGPVEPMVGLDALARATITAADTVFVASQARAGVGGADISHRGGEPGFIRVDGDRLVVPDYIGNRYFNTLGNLLGDPRAALLFVDFDRGDLLQVKDRVTIAWTGLRHWTVAIEGAWRRRGAVPLRWSTPEPSPFLAATGHEASGQRA